MSHPSARLPTALYRAEQVRELDRVAIQVLGIPGYTLMTRAGEAVYRALRTRWPEAGRITVVCGVGNNAGDGYVVARCARADGLDVGVVEVGDAGRLRGTPRRPGRTRRKTVSLPGPTRVRRVLPPRCWWTRCSALVWIGPSPGHGARPSMR